MPDEAHYRRLANMHATANCNQTYTRDLQVAISAGRCEMVLPMRPEFYHAAGAVHGYIYFKMMDEAAFFAANSYIDDAFLLTTDFHLSLLRPIKTGTMRVVGTATYMGKNRFMADAELFNDEGKMLARGSGTFVRGFTTLDADVGYKD